MSNLPPDPYDRTVIVEPNIDNPDRAPLAGTGRDFVVSLKPADTPGRTMMFLNAAGTWVPFSTTELTSWGSIVGNIEDQADLMALFAEYSKTTEFAPVAFTGQYSSLSGLPTLGTVSPLNLNGATSMFLRGDGVWAIPVDVNAEWGNINGNINAQTDLINLLNQKAPINNPTFTGFVRAPSPPVDDSSDLVITSAWFFGQAFNSNPVMDGTASSGDSTRWARGNHRHPSDTSRAPLESPAFTGIPLAPTPAPGDNSTRVATTAFVTAAIASAGLTPPPSDGQYYAFRNGAWVPFVPATLWDNDGVP